MQGIFYFEILYTKTFEARQRSRKDTVHRVCSDLFLRHTFHRSERLEKGRWSEEQSVGILPSLIAYRSHSL